MTFVSSLNVEWPAVRDEKITADHLFLPLERK
jgi:hypothetical protein